ncbi:MAG TPA: hypothetical protein DCS87_07335 [Rheinheimera sp.]|nr:hypothetical protein [Rheinheimera sp.]
MSAYLMLLACVIVGGLGVVHGYLTFFSHVFAPRDVELAQAMLRVSPRISSATTMWRAGQGFHASHSLGALLFALIYGYLSLQQPALLFASVALQLIGAVYLLCLALLAFRYWFKVPQRGVVLATVCYLLACWLA